MARDQPIKGYALLSEYMARHQYPIFRSYRSLAARDLLFMQAELFHLEVEYQKIAKEDKSSGTERQYYDLAWSLLSTGEKRSSPLDSEADRQVGGSGKQWAKALEIRQKLKDYYASLKQYSDIASITQPTQDEIFHLHDFVARPDLGGGCMFAGEDMNGEPPQVYSEENIYDLLILAHARGENDAFTRFFAGPVTKAFFKIFHTFLTSEPLNRSLPTSSTNASRLYAVNNARVHAAIYFIGTIFSSLAPLCSIIVLFVLQNESVRLGVVCAFTIAFSIILAVATNARRIEIFAATAAFAGVQVVFIGSTVGANSQARN